MSGDTAESAIWRALGDPTRRQILDLLRPGPKTTGALAGAFEISRFGVMKHLGVLVDAGLVNIERRGKERWNHLNAVPLQAAIRRWFKPYDEAWASRLLTLKEQLETKEGGSPMTMEHLPNATHLHIRQEIAIAAPPEKVFEALTRDIASWWGAPFLYNAGAVDIVLEAEPGGRMLEVLPGGGGSVWAWVECIEAPKLLQLSGRFAMASGVIGHVIIELEPTEAGTSLVLTHRAVGQIEAETEANFGQGWQELMGNRLRRFVEDGERLGLRSAA